MASKSKEYNEEYIKYNPKVIPVNAENHQDSFLYWKSIEKLDSKQIKGLSNTKFARGSFQRNTNWTHVVTWVWFRPKLLRITCILWWPPWCISIWSGTSNANQSSNWTYFLTWALKGFVQSYIVYIVDWTTPEYASLTSLDADWFTLQWTKWGNYIEGHWEAYW